MITIWEQCQKDMPEYAKFIQAGLSKLQSYFHLAIQVPAYQLAICIVSFFKCRVTNKLNFIASLVLHPLKKLSWFIQHMPNKVQDVHQMFLRSVCGQISFK